jgi:hypothetical protein
LCLLIFLSTFNFFKNTTTIIDKGYEPFSAKYNKVHGLDTVGVKWKNEYIGIKWKDGAKRMEEIMKDPTKLLTYADDIEEIAIVEAKYNADGYLQIGKNKHGEQLSAEQIEHAMLKMKNSDKEIVKKMGELMDSRPNLVNDAVKYFHILDESGAVKTIEP